MNTPAAATLSVAPIFLPTYDKERQEFEDAVWGMHPPGAVNFVRNSDGSYIDGQLNRFWELWQLARK